MKANILLSLNNDNNKNIVHMLSADAANSWLKVKI